MRRRQLMARSLAIAASASQAGCVTRHLFEPHQYTEDVSSILIAQDGSALVFVSRDYHYVFKPDATLLAALKPPVHAHLKAQIQTLVLDGDGEGTLPYWIAVPKSAPPEIQRAVEALGFGRNHNEEFFATGKITGKRYAANGIHPGGNATSLNRHYKVEVQAPLSLGEKARVAPLTPLAIAADGVAVIAGAVLLPFVWPLMLGGK